MPNIIFIHAVCQGGTHKSIPQTHHYREPGMATFLVESSGILSIVLASLL